MTQEFEKVGPGYIHGRAYRDGERLTLSPRGARYLLIMRAIKPIAAGPAEAVEAEVESSGDE